MAFAISMSIYYIKHLRPDLNATLGSTGDFARSFPATQVNTFFAEGK